jgi:hypothetical protein
MSKPDVDAYRACTRQVTKWFVSTLERDGTIRDELDLIAYYHAPNLLAVTDHAIEAQRMASWLAKNALADDGDFRYREKKGDIIQPSMQWNYINGWLVWGLARLGRFDVSEAAARFLERFQDASGGFTTAADPEGGFAPVSGAVDMGSTCAGALGMIYSGRWRAATRAGEHLLEALQHQRSGESFYCRFRSDGSPITEFPEEQAYVSVVRFDQPKQAYWYFGFAARVLALLHRATGREDFLDGALGYIAVFDRCHEDRWEHWANDKVAWASAALYQITGETVHAERVARCFDPIVAAQRDDAVWHWETFFPDYAEQPRGITIELALEFGFLLHEIVSEIDSR